jgi:transcriptional regulator with XRE-family HTH domain
MTDPGTARVAARIALGRALRVHRRVAGLSGAEAGQRLGWSQSKVSRIEAARVRAEVNDVQALLKLYGVRGGEHAEALHLAEEAAGAASEWRNSSRVGLSRRQQDFVAFEASASSILHYQPALIPGPLQTSAYAARVLAMVEHPDPQRAIDTRMARRAALLGPDGPRLSVVLSELAVRWNPGPEGVLTVQLRTLADLVDTHGICLRIVRMDGEQPTFLAHPAVVYDFGGEVYEALVETTTMDIRVTDADELKRLAQRINQLADAGMSTEASVAHVRELANRTAHRRRRT